MKIHIIDKLLIKGVLVDRDQNGYNFDYNLLNSLEDIGIRYYCHKYILYGGNYNPSHDKTGPIAIGIRNRQVLLRFIVQFTGDYSLVREGTKFNEKIVQTHTFIYENQLLLPKIKTLIESNYLAWIREYGIDPQKWKVVDVDNFMKGNPYFKKIIKEEEAKKEIAEDKSLEIDARVVDTLFEKMLNNK